MATTRLSGPVYPGRLGNAIVYHTFKVSGNSSTVAAGLTPLIQASASNPVVIEGSILVTTLDGGTTPTMSIGITSTATELVSGASTATAAANGTFLPASNAVGRVVVTADTQLFYKQGGTPNGTGVIWLIFGVFELNTNPIA